MPNVMLDIVTMGKVYYGVAAILIKYYITTVKTSFDSVDIRVLKFFYT